MQLRNDWRAVCIERCKHGSEGGAQKPGLETVQGAGRLPNKTSTAISLAAGIARKKKRVLLIDIDSQANSSKVLHPNYQSVPKEQTLFSTILQRLPLPIHATSIPNLDIVPSHILLSNTDVELTLAKDHREERLKRELDKI